MTNRIYLDHAATTPLDPRVRTAMELWQKELGNPNSIHAEGQRIRGAIDESRRTVAHIFERDEKQVVFIPSATAANNLILEGVIKRFKRLYTHVTPEIIISPLEHASVYEVARRLEREQEIVLTILSIDEQGRISPKELREKISPRTALVSIQWVNNETGIIQPVKEIIEILREYRTTSESAYPFFHTDAVQGIGHGPHQDLLGIDYITLSAHKIYGPTGIGVLLIPQEPLLEPIIYGGGQENGWWSGTESVDRIVGCAHALSYVIEEQKDQFKNLLELYTYAKEVLQTRIPQVSFYGDDKFISPHILSFRIPGVLRPDIALDLAGIAVSSGAACSQQSVAPSRVLQVLGASVISAQESIRVSFGKQTTKKDIDQLIDRIIIIQERSTTYVGGPDKNT
ncbi:MAG: cysteine desulfurase family protein [Candidatus Paceibacterota bacterium]